VPENASSSEGLRAHRSEGVIAVWTDVSVSETSGVHQPRTSDLLIRCRNNGSDGAAKLLAVTGVVLALSIIAQVVWAFTARLLLSARGLPVSSLGADAAHFWSDVLGVQVRPRC